MHYETNLALKITLSSAREERSGTANPSHAMRLLTFECPPDIFMNRLRPHVHEATGGHAIRTIPPCRFLKGYN